MRLVPFPSLHIGQAARSDPTPYMTYTLIHGLLSQSPSAVPTTPGIDINASLCSSSTSLMDLKGIYYSHFHISESHANYSALKGPSFRANSIPSACSTFAVARATILVGITGGFVPPASGTLGVVVDTTEAGVAAVYGALDTVVTTDEVVGAGARGWVAAICCTKIAVVATDEVVGAGARARVAAIRCTKIAVVAVCIDRAENDTSVINCHNESSKHWANKIGNRTCRTASK